MPLWHAIKHDKDQWFIDLEQFGAFVLMFASEPTDDGGTDGRAVFFVRCHYRMPNNDKFIDLALSQPACKVRGNAEGILNSIQSQLLTKKP